MSDSIVVTSNQPQQAPAQSQADSAAAETKAEETKPSAQAQGDEQVEDATTEGESDEADAQEASEPEKPKKKSGIQRLKERHAREMAAIHREIERLKESQAHGGQREGEQQTRETQADGKPRAEQFETHEEFVEALTDWKLEQREKLKEQKSKEAQAKQAAQEQAQSHNERVKKYRESNPDYDSAVEEFIEERGDVRFSFGLTQAIQESEHGPAILHEIFKNPEMFDRLNSMSLTAVLREVGRLEERIGSKASPKAEIKKTTKAPPPPKPVTAGASSEKSIFTAQSQAEYESIRRAQIAKRASSWG